MLNQRLAVRSSPAQPGTDKSKQQGDSRVSTHAMHYSRLGKAVTAPNEQGIEGPSHHCRVARVKKASKQPLGPHNAQGKGKDSDIMIWGSAVEAWELWVVRPGSKSTPAVQPPTRKAARSTKPT